MKEVASMLLNKIKEKYPNDELIFCNGGDRDKNNIPEMVVENISFKFGVGGNRKKTLLHGFLKIGSMKAKKVWGLFYNLFDSDDVKVKELIIKPQKGMSFQRHKKRNEIWLVSKGSCKGFVFQK